MKLQRFIEIAVDVFNEEGALGKSLRIEALSHARSGEYFCIRANYEDTHILRKNITKKKSGTMRQVKKDGYYYLYFNEKQ